MKNLLFYAPLIIILALFSCSKSDKNEEDLSEVFSESCNELSFPGLSIEIDGNTDALMEDGSDSYNDYLECLENCSQTDPGDNECVMNCLNSSGILPSGGAFTLVLYITNITVSEITITIDAGTWFLPGSDDYQPMLIVKSVTITIAAGETITEVVPVYCLAASKSAPNEDSEYSVCEQVSLSCLEEIINILNTKDVSAIGFMQSIQIQQIIWACSEGDPVDFAYLNSLPDAK